MIKPTVRERDTVRSGRSALEAALTADRVHDRPAGDNGLITEALKDLSLSHRVPVIAIAAADRSALDAMRLRLHDLRGSSALAYEADVAIIPNDKPQCGFQGAPRLRPHAG